MLRNKSLVDLLKKRKPFTYRKVCSEHFSDEQYVGPDRARLRKDAVPDRNLQTKDEKELCLIENMLQLEEIDNVDYFDNLPTLDFLFHLHNIDVH